MNLKQGDTVQLQHLLIAATVIVFVHIKSFQLKVIMHVLSLMFWPNQTLKRAIEGTFRCFVIRF